MFDKRLLKFILITVAILLVLGVWFWLRNTYSKDMLKLEILAPSEIEAGSEVVYTIRYKNNGNIRFENPKLIFEYPEGAVIAEETRELSDERTEFKGGGRVEVLLDEIAPGEERTVELKSFVFGKENSTVTAKATIYYKPKNLNVEYDSETTHTMAITRVPITFDLHLPLMAEAEKDFSFDVNYFSKINYPISNLRIKINYPSDFRFSDARPRPSFEDSEWEIGVLNEGQGGRIEVSGNLKGEPGQAKNFKATLGFWQENNFIALKEVTRGIEIATPLIYITYRVNGSPSYIASPGEYIHYEIFFRNTGESPLEDLFMTARLNRDTVDFGRIQADRGSLQEGAGMIVWDSRDVPELEFLSPMKEGKVEFWVKVREDIEKTNPEVEVELSLNQFRRRISTKVNTGISFVQKGYFREGPFNNYGPQPPRVGSLTSYTIHWKVENRNNDLKNLRVRANLPEGARLSAETYPDDARISFDSASREVLWNIGDLVSGSGIEAYFQVVFDPPSDQQGGPAQIISEAYALGSDTWTESVVRTISASIDTTLPDDPSVSEEMGVIQ